MNKQQRNQNTLEQRFNLIIKSASNKYFQITGQKDSDLNYYIIPAESAKVIETKYGKKLLCEFENSEMKFWISIFNVIKLWNGNLIINDYNNNHKKELARLAIGFDEVISLKYIIEQNNKNNSKINDIMKKEGELTEEDEKLIDKLKYVINPLHINKKVINPGVLRESWDF